MPRPTPLPPEIGAGPFHVRDAAEFGVSSERLRRSDLVTPFRGVRLAKGGPDDLLTSCAALALRLRDDQYFCGMTAARLLGFRLPRYEGTLPLDVATPSPGRASRTAGARGHELPRSTPVVTLSTGLRVSAPVDTWCQLAKSLGRDQLTMAGDGLVCRKNPAATMTELVDATHDWKGRPAAPKLRASLADIRPRTDSARETMLRLMIVRAGFPEPVVNFAILDPDGQFLGFGDLCYPDQKVVIEYDGAQHREDEEQYHHDIERLDAFMEDGWRVIRVNKALMSRPVDLYAKLRAALH